MRAFLGLALVAAAVAACSPTIPVKQEFGVSALVASGDIPPEFAGFNSFNPAADDLVADQICATSLQRLQGKTFEAVPGQFEQLISRCRTHVPLFGS